MISFKTYYPQVLTRFVKFFWSLRVPEESTVYEEDIIPDGHHEIIFHLNKAAFRKNLSGDWVSEPEAFVAGQTNKVYTLQLLPGAVLYGIRFYPHTLSSLLKVPAFLFTDIVTDLSNFKQSKLLINCIHESEKVTFSRFEKTLTSMLKNETGTNRFEYINNSVRQILNNSGSTNIDAVIRSTGISGKYLDTLFKNYVGINPKKFAAIIRLNSFINYRKENPHETLTQCGYEAGFFDQSHLIKTFRETIGCTPKTFFQNKNTISNSFAGL